MTAKIHATTLLYNFVQDRPGFEAANYDSRKSLYADMRRADRQRKDFFALLTAAHEIFRDEDALDAALLAAAPGAYMGRLAFLPASGRLPARIEYTAGQYYCIEYRAAACAVVAAALWGHCREKFASRARAGESAGDAIRREFRALLGPRIAKRWLD